MKLVANSVPKASSGTRHAVAIVRLIHEPPSPRAARCALHAAALEFVHPETRRGVRVECEMAPDMAALWAGLAGEGS